MKARRFRSFAKINLGLEVTGRLPNGYHELKTIFAAITLHDVIEMAPRKAGITVACDDPTVPTDQTNLAYRAAALMQQLGKTKRGVAINIRKRIPVGGGVGGGSSNAATVLRALDLIWNLKLGPAGLLDAAKALGADVPYFLIGGPALGVGRGDDITPLDLRIKERVLLVPGAGGVSTAKVFGRFAKSRRRENASAIDALLRTRTTKASSPRLEKLRNELEPAAVAESPELASTARQVRAAGKATGASLALMSGSGSSFFLLVKDADAAKAAARDLQARGLAGVGCSILSRRSYLSRFEIKS